MEKAVDRLGWRSILDQADFNRGYSVFEDNDECGIEILAYFVLSTTGSTLPYTI